ncbi:Arylsulfatase [Roseimaritima multifibrata]|uniref:Arylsulfatase n=2 Tax=Roseimaritima multifibrata TaxID=1930274 RepID=A0A517MCG2_9BACT|nr:Arylsulfatase [Roseimaritima multifibrata]
MVKAMKMRKRTTIITAFLLVGAAIPAVSADSQNKPARPNIVLVMADDLGGRDLPAYGNRFNETPNIDRLAVQGTVFHNAYAAPVCSATRASIQSGQYPARVGIFDFIPGHWRPFEKVIAPKHRTQHLPEDIVTLGDVMQSAGYKTGYFGKWHLNNGRENLPNTRGYEFAHMYAGGGFYAPKFVPPYDAGGDKRLSNQLTEMSIDFMKENKDQPFFLFLSHYDVHVQLDADKDLIDKYLDKKKTPDYPGNAVYAAMIEHVDNSVGDMMQATDELGLTDNTIFIFYSDNGGVDNRFDNVPLLTGKGKAAYPEGHPLTYIATSNTPLRAGKGTLYEGGIRVPLIVRWPGKVASGATSEAIVSSVDFYPTFLDLVQGKAPEKQVLDGFSMLPALTKNKFDTERELFTHYPVFHHEQPMSALRKGDWKIVQNLVSGEFELFNLKYDVNEMTDLKFSYAEKTAEMKKALAKWQSDTNAQNPVPNPDFDPSKRYEWGTHPDRK